MLWVTVIFEVLAVPVWLALSRMQSDRAEPVMDAVVQRFLAEHAAALDATRRPVARIELSRMAVDDPLASKVGGGPWSPQGHAMPPDVSDRP